MSLRARPCRFLIAVGLAALAGLADAPAASAQAPTGPELTPTADGGTDLGGQLQALQEQLRQLQEKTGASTGTSTGATGTAPAAKPAPPKPVPLVLQPWHKNLTASQLKLLAKTMRPASFDPDQAADPEQCLTVFRQAVGVAKSYEEVLPFLSRRRRQHYLLSEGHPDFRKHRKSDADWLAPLRSVLGSIVQVESTIESDTRPDRVQIVAWTARGEVYSRIRIEMHGEGRLWRWAGHDIEAVTTRRPAALVEKPTPGAARDRLQPGQTEPTDLESDLSLGEQFGD